ncbi:MAG: nucleotide sugar dehydrogenase [Acidobacteriaceae bacterium]
MRIAVIGAGHVGLVVAACFAEIGHTVVSVDDDAAKIAELGQGKVPIHEHFLPELLQRHWPSRLSFTTSLSDAVAQSEAIFIAVGTPALENGEADMSSVEEVARGIADSVNGYKVIVEKSTVPVSTSDFITRILLRNGTRRDMFDVASNPEFLREGTGVTDFLHPDRIIVGTASEDAYKLLERIYHPLTSGRYYKSLFSVEGGRSVSRPAPLLRTSAESAELIKHASNAFLATKISFINSIANICDAVQADISEVAQGLGMDQRIGPRFLAAGVGYGGSCFPKDTKSLRAISSRAGVDFRLLDEVERINEVQQANFLRKIRFALGQPRGKKLGVLGLSFKGGTDDVRESPAIRVVLSLIADGCIITAYDPAAMKNAQAVLPEGSVAFAENAYQVMDEADALVVLTDWVEFSHLDMVQIKQRLGSPIVLDGRNMFDSSAMKEMGLTYVCVGRPSDGLVTAKQASSAGKRKKRALVTGAAGFLGSHMVDALLAEGYSVLGVDNLLTGRVKNIQHLNGDPHFEFLRHDISEPFDPGTMDMVFNMASPASPVDYTLHGVETLLVGSSGTRNALEIARRYKAKFLHCSTSECYGDPLIHPQPESYWGHVNPIGPRSVYDESKRFSEALIMAYHRYYGVDTRLVRIFNTYGPRLQLNDGRVISNFLRQALCGEDLTIYGDGSQTRSFCYVSDQIDGLLRLMHSDEHYPVNIGNPEEFTILECANEVLAATGSESRLVFRSLPQDDPKQRCPDITRAKTLLGWTPKVRLPQGLHLSIPWFAENIGKKADNEHLASRHITLPALIELPLRTGPSRTITLVDSMRSVSS